MRALIAFPNPVNEKAARTVAAGVVVLGACADCADITGRLARAGA